MVLREQQEANERKELVELNFNNYALVKLTEHGKNIYDQFLLSRRLNPNDYTIKTTEDGFAKIQLWELMEIFGSAMYNGNPNLPFEDMNFKMEMEKRISSDKKKSDFGKRVLDVIKQELKVNVVSGDITKVKSDSLVAPINSGGMWFGAIDGAIQRIAGGQFHQQAQNRLPLNHLDTVVAKKQSNHNGGFQNVVFVIDDLQTPLNEVVLSGLQAADEAGYSSVSVPTMRMGVMMGSVEKTAEETIQQMKIGVDKFKNQGPKNLKSITFVVYNDDKTQKLMEQTFSI